MISIILLLKDKKQSVSGTVVLAQYLSKFSRDNEVYTFDITFFLNWDWNIYY